MFRNHYFLLNCAFLVHNVLNDETVTLFALIINVKLVALSRVYLSRESPILRGPRNTF